MTPEEAAKYLGYERCEFDDECDSCKEPEQGSYVELFVSEAGTEAVRYVCGKCIVPIALGWMNS